MSFLIGGNIENRNRTTGRSILFRKWDERGELLELVREKKVLTMQTQPIYIYDRKYQQKKSRDAGGTEQKKRAINASSYVYV